MANFYCANCGTKTSSVSSLTANYCSRYPDGKGKHVLYEGTEKAKYTCKYCGTQTSSISSLTANYCSRHPNKKGRHSPAL